VGYNLSNFYLFQNCSKNLIDEISENLLIRNAISGETIFNQGDVPKNLYIVLEGSLYVTEFTEDGKAVAHELISKGDCFGEIAIIDQKLRSASILCAENVKLGVLSSNFVQNVLLKDINICTNLLQKFSSIIRKMNTQVFNLVTASAKKRLLFHISYLSESRIDKPGKKILDKSLSHADLAALSGMTRETVSRIMSELRNEGFISNNVDGEIEILVKKLAENPISH
tara:strand:+ start:374 stop:1051 length:678 start_codon:yes stop_codon:yes gene_type:complete